MVELHRQAHFILPAGLRIKLLLVMALLITVRRTAHLAEMKHAFLLRIGHQTIERIVLI